MYVEMLTIIETTELPHIDIWTINTEHCQTVSVTSTKGRGGWVNTSRV